MPLRVPVTPAYRANILIAALVVLAVPVLYVLFLFAAGTVTGVVALTGAAWVQGYITGVLYVTSLAGLVTMLLFLIRALFRWPRINRDFRVLEPGAHPRLEARVAEVCALVGAPYPTEIAVDLSLNAGASLLHPGRDLVTRRYRLTLGLPLVAISSEQHVIHLIAHEVGHFSQHGAMRLRQLLHWNEYYLDDLVNRRDRWDVWLAARKQGVLVEQLGALVASTGLRMGRLYLRGLLWLVQWSNARLSREMEFHADLVSIRVAGTPVFLESIEVLAGGFAAIQQAGAQAQRLRSEGRHIADFPALTAAYYEAIPPEQRAELARQRRFTLGLGFDSHPDDTDRAEQADRADDAGLLLSTGEAAGLFADFAALCHEETVRDLGGAAVGEAVEAVAAFAESVTRDEADGSRILYFGAVYDTVVWLVLGEVDPVPEEEWEAVIAAGGKAVDDTLEYFATVTSAYSDAMVNTLVVRRLEAGLPVEWQAVEKEPVGVEPARKRMYESDTALTDVLRGFHEAALPIRRRLFAAWERRGALPEADAERFARLVQAVRGMERADAMTTQLATDLAVLSNLLDALPTHLEGADFQDTIESEFRSALRHAERFDATLRDVAMPFDWTGDMASYALPNAFDPDSGVPGYLNTYGEALQRLRDLRLRIMGELAELAVRVETTRVPVEESPPR